MRQHSFLYILLHVGAPLTTIWTLPRNHCVTKKFHLALGLDGSCSGTRVVQVEAPLTEEGVFVYVFDDRRRGVKRLQRI